MSVVFQLLGRIQKGWRSAKSVLEWLTETESVRTELSDWDAVSESSEPQSLSKPAWTSEWLKKAQNRYFLHQL